jgi:hypothetical protein
LHRGPKSKYSKERVCYRSRTHGTFSMDLKHTWQNINSTQCQQIPFNRLHIINHATTFLSFSLHRNKLKPPSQNHRNKPKPPQQNQSSPQKSSNSYQFSIRNSSSSIQNKFKVPEYQNGKMCSTQQEAFRICGRFSVIFLENHHH